MQISRVIGLIILTVFISPAKSQELTIRVLGVYESGADISSATLNLVRIPTIWSNSSISTPVTITVANVAVPVALGGSLVGGTADAQLDDARTRVLSLRAQYAADIVIVFVDEIPTGSGLACGAANQAYWTWEGNTPPLFLPTTFPGLDLRGRDVFFVALVATDNDLCRTTLQLAAHEFGHLLGGGHERVADPSNIGYYLYPDSHADKKRHTPGGKGAPPSGGYKTVLAQPNPIGCGTFGEMCPYIDEYSSQFTGEADPNLNKNIHALGDTALSVANYYVTPPSQCDLSPPYGVAGFVLYNGDCYPGENQTSHRVTWLNDCREVVSHYEVFAQQPSGTGNYDFIGSVSGSAVSFDVAVSGSPANVKVGACVGSACTGPSLSYYLAYASCNP